MYASSGNKHFFTKSCHRQTYQYYEQSRQKLGTILENNVCTLKIKVFKRFFFKVCLLVFIEFFFGKIQPILTQKNDFESTNIHWKNPLKKSSQKILPKKFSLKIPPKIFVPRNSWQQNYLQKNPLKKFLPKNSYHKIISKIPKKFLRFWNYPIPYIALRRRKLFRACYPLKSN